MYYDYRARDCIPSLMSLRVWHTKRVGIPRTRSHVMLALGYPDGCELPSLKRTHAKHGNGTIAREITVL